VAVGVACGVVELGGDTGFEFFRDEVFEAFGFVVEFVERIVEDFEEEGFYEAMVANDFQRAFAAGSGQADTTSTLVGDERAALGGKLLQHVGDGGWRDAEVRGELRAADAALLGATEGVDGFEVVVNRLAGAVLGAGLHKASLLHLAI